jgi:two-component system, sporulation sensor kinase E
MRSFVQRALGKLNKLDKSQIRSLIWDLALENERFEGVLHSLDEGVLVVDENNLIIFMNRKSERLLSFAGKDPQEKIIWDVVSDPQISEFLESALTTQESVRDRDFTLEAGDIRKTLAFTVLPYLREGKIAGSVIHLDDVTDKRIQEAKNRRMENLASLTTLAAGVAHEIKNPLGSIGIHIQLIQRSLNKGGKFDRQEINGYLDIVNEEVERLNRIVVDFLFAVRPMDTKLEESDLNRLVQDLIQFMQYELEEADINAQLWLDDSLPKLLLDERFIKQALLNVVKNAMAAMPEGGTLTVETRRREDDVVLRISDTGKGMTEEVLNKIFEPYFTTKEFGSGIGLTLVYKVIKEHNGDIFVDSKEGKGTSFDIHLPLPQREKRLLDWKGHAG